MTVVTPGMVSRISAIGGDDDAVGGHRRCQGLLPPPPSPRALVYRPADLAERLDGPTVRLISPAPGMKISTGLKRR
jgi:hypothetical protein